MKKKEIKDLFIKPVTELRAMRDDAREKLYALNRDREAGKLKDTAGILKAKRYAARIVTALRAQELRSSEKGAKE